MPPAVAKTADNPTIFARPGPLTLETAAAKPTARARLRPGLSLRPAPRRVRRPSGVAGLNLVVATPSFGGQISILYAASLLKLQKALRRYRGVNLKILFKDGDALITRARASLIAQFLDDPDATHLLFIDADIGFEPEQVLRLIQCGAPMCAAVYPIKRIDWDKVKSTIDTARPDPAAAALKYVFEVDDPNAVMQSRLRQSPLCRHRFLDDPARGA